MAAFTTGVVHTDLFVGLIRESLFVHAEAQCVGLPMTPEFRMARNIWQGGVQSPWCWNLVVKTVLAQEGGELHSLGIEVPMMGKRAALGWAG